MTEQFETEALGYLLDDLDAERRGAFEEKLAREPSARASVDCLADSLTVLRRQARDLPSFGGFVHAEVELMLEATVEKPRRQLWRGLQKIRQFVALT